MTQDQAVLLREKYGGVVTPAFVADSARLDKGEPLAYVIGTQPFLGCTISLDSKPLIPRPETEWWVEKCIQSMPDTSLSVLDLCSGSGAIGCAILKHAPHARVTMSELEARHKATIEKNIQINAFDGSRVRVLIGDLFSNVGITVFDRILINPPYIPRTRVLPQSVTDYEPHEALFAGTDGLSVLRRIAQNLRSHLKTDGEAWIECDALHATATAALFRSKGYAVALHTDQYERPRYLVVS